MIRRPPRSTQSRSSAASDVYKRQCSCNAGYYDSGGTCVTCTAGYYCTGDNYSTLCPSNMTSSSGSVSQGNCSCVDNSWTSCVYPSCNPPKYTGTKYCNCDDLILVAYPALNNGCEIGYTFSNQYYKECSSICCGDGRCSNYESASTCAADCGYCGDGYCTSSLGETCSNCTNDCGGCSCWGDYECDAGQTCEGPGYCLSLIHISEPTR